MADGESLQKNENLLWQLELSLNKQVLTEDLLSEDQGFLMIQHDQLICQSYLQFLLLVSHHLLFSARHFLL